MKMTLNEEIEYLQSGDWYDKAQTFLSRDEYLKLGWAIGDILETLELLRSLMPEPETNADVIRRMSDEELAEFLCDFRSCDSEAHPCTGCKAEAYCRMGHNGMIDWLQQPAEEDT